MRCVLASRPADRAQGDPAVSVRALEEVIDESRRPGHHLPTRAHERLCRNEPVITPPIPPAALRAPELDLAPAEGGRPGSPLGNAALASDLQVLAWLRNAECLRPPLQTRTVEAGVIGVGQRLGDRAVLWLCQVQLSRKPMSGSASWSVSFVLGSSQ